MTGADDLRASMEREAKEFQQRRRVARMLTGTTAIADPERHRGGRPPAHEMDYYERKEAERRSPNANFHRVDERKGVRLENHQERDPCGFCGTRRDRHAEFGCKRWRCL